LKIALEANGVEVVPAQEDTFGWNPHMAKNCDAVIWTHSHHFTNPEIYPDIENFLDEMREQRRPTIAFHLDRWLGLGREVQLAYDPYFLCSLVITADGGHDDVWPTYGINHLWMPPAISHVDAEREVEATSHVLRQKKVGFVGSWHGYHLEWPWREQMVLWLRRTYGSKLALYPVYGRSLRGKDLSVFYRCVPVIVGDSCLAPRADGKPITNYWSDRIPETIGRGGFLLHPYVKGIDEHFTPGEHFVTYEPYDFDALKELIEYWGEHVEERWKIAQAGHEHVLAHHTYKHRIRDVLKLVEDGKANWPS